MKVATIAAALLALAALVAPAHPGRAQSCRTLAEMAATFAEVYPTGGLVEHVDGAAGERVMNDLLAPRGGDAVAFLYSGDGPVTGARGRYLYLVLDAAGCILRQDWIDGEAFDRIFAD